MIAPRLAAKSIQKSTVDIVEGMAMMTPLGLPTNAGRLARTETSQTTRIAIPVTTGASHSRFSHPLGHPDGAAADSNRLLYDAIAPDIVR
jgi:hypothetical protein